MKCIERYFTIAVVMLVLLTGCTGSSEGADPGPNEAATATAVADAGTTPDPSEVEVEPEFTEQQRIDVALAALDEAVANGEGPEETIAYDLLGSEFDPDDGIVTFTICAWTGTSITETVRDSLWRTTVQDDGTLAASHVTTPVAAGDCQNSQLIESALQTVQEFDTFWQDTTAEPATFATDPRVDELLTPSLAAFLDSVAAGWVDAGLNLANSRQPGPVLDNLAADLLWRSSVGNEASVVEFAICREMVPEHGLYRDGVLIDSGMSEKSTGSNSIDAFQLQPDLGAPTGWRVAGRSELVWADCFRTNDWPAAANSWREAPIPFEVFER